MNQAREKIIRNRLNKMAGWAKQRREYLKNLPEDWNEDWYIRIGGNGFTAVSLNDNSPLIGFSDESDEDIKKIICQFKQNQAKNISDSHPERRVQCWLIKQAISHQLDLKRVLCADDREYDELLFAFDEISFGDKYHRPIRRCDILAIGVNNGDAFPVLIELKSSHDLEKLLGQLKDYQTEMEGCRHEFENLFNSCISDKKVNLSKCKKIIVWNRLPSGKVSPKTFDRCKQENVAIIQYDWDHCSDISNITFEPYPGLAMAP